MTTRHKEASPKALNASGLSIRPVWDYNTLFDVDADREFFMAKHGNSATARQLEADCERFDEVQMRDQVAVCRRIGMSWTAIGKKLEIDHNAARAIYDPEWGEARRARRSANAINRRLQEAP